MNLFHGTQAYARSLRSGPGPVVTIGNFDGVHLGHRALVDATRALALELGGPSCVLTFDPAPRDVLRPDNDIPRIQSLHDKLQHLGDAGIDHIVIERFDRALASRSPRWFADEILGARLRAAGLVVGWDFRFGKKRAGTVDDLRTWLAVPIRQVEPLVLDGDDAPVSSSRIRAAVREGAVVEAARLLGRPYELVGRVEAGDQRGRELGFPTANVRTMAPLMPPHGVYAVRASWGGDWHAGVANLGTRPTFVGGPPVLEVHLLDHDGDLYGRQLRVGLVDRIRDERAFDGPEALVAAIHDDVARARAILA